MNRIWERLEEKTRKETLMGEQEREKPDFSAADEERIGWEGPSYTESESKELDAEFLAANRCIAFSLDIPEAEAYRLLRTQILQRAREKGGNTLMVTSSVPGEGKTLTAVNLAFAIAKEFNQTVLLVDCDLRQQKVYRMLGIRSEKGLVDYLLDRSPLEDLILWPGVEKITLISGGQTLKGSSELLGSAKMKNLVEELKTRYPDRFVIFDLPPVLSAADALVFAPLVDHTVLVVQAGKTPLPEVKKALEMLPKEKILGIVLNRNEDVRKSYYYGYPPQKPSEQQTYALALKETVRTSSEILKGIRVGDFLYACKEKIWDTPPRKILTISILSLAILLAVFHYYPLWPGLDSFSSGEKRYPSRGGSPSGVTSPDPKVASVQKETVVGKPETPPPIPPQKPGGQDSHANRSAPAVSSNPASSAPSEAPPAVASKETGAAKAADTDNSEKVKKISKESPPPNKMEPLPKRGFYSIKIMALRDPEKAQEFMESQKKKGLDIHSRTTTIQDQGLWHQILWGHFGSRNEAQRFLEENKILQLYPGSTIIKLSR
jgi:non-specific protein-tyrosine kinase